MKKNLYYILVTLITMSACSKKELDPSVMTLLTGNSIKSWQIVEVIAEGGNEAPCRNDDIFVFTLFDEDLGQPAWQIQDNFVACDAYSGGGFVASEGFWRLNNKENRLTLTTGTPTDGFNVNFLYHIEEISETDLRLRVEVEDEYGFQLKREYIIFKAL